MRGNWMLSVSLTVLAMAVGIAQTSAAEVCAAKSKTLRSFTIFDGPPSQKASLVPDSADKVTATWEVGGVYDAGRIVWVRCEYAGGSHADAKLAQKVAKCESRAVKKDVFKLNCQ